jgi:acyl-coenzyme A thioesterase PaaI-like protein
MTVATDAGEPLTLPWLADSRFRCFGCSPHNPVGLALSLRRLPDGRVGAWTTLPERFASYPGIVHGGVLSTLVDEVMGNLVALERGRLAFCATLRTRMLAPLRTGRPYLASARLLDAGTDGAVIRAEADVSDVDGEVHATASGTYQPIRAAHARVLMGLDDAGYATVQHYFDHQMGT